MMTDVLGNLSCGAAPCNLFNYRFEGGDEEFLNLSAAPFLPRPHMPTILNVAPAITIVVIDADDDVEQEENMSMMMREEEEEEEEEEGIVMNYSQW